MTVMVNFNVRNPDWYWSADQIKEMGGYEEWKMLNDSKVPRHIPTWAFQIAFDVKDVKENRKANYELKFSVPSSPDVIQSVILENMTHVIFTNGDEKAEVVIANDIMHSFLGARQSGRKYYWYFYIKENVEYVQITNTIWITEKQSLLLP